MPTLTPEWISNSDILLSEVDKEIAKVRSPKFTMPVPQFAPPVDTTSPDFLSPLMQTPQPTPVQMPVQTPVINNRAVATPVVTPTTQTTKQAPVQEVIPEDIPFWKRALNVFAAPFEWIDKYAIKPGEAAIATGLNLIPEVKRNVGEDYWDWKRRSWEDWKPPGIDINVPWSNKPMTIDIRGVAELAPWLLIPGAGEVGSATRAGAGVAGVLGKLGDVGKIVGTVVEYSPWGLVEKGTSAMVRGITGLVGKTESRISEKIVGKIPEPPPPHPDVQELTTFFKDVVNPARTAFEAKLPELRAKQIAQLAETEAKFKAGEITATEWANAQRVAGDIKSQFKVPTQQFTPEKVDNLLSMIAKSSEKGFVKKDSAEAMYDLLLNGTLPEPHNIRDFAKVYGDQFAQSVQKLTKVSKLDSFIDLMNLPRSVLASGDLSAVARQGLILGLMHPTKVPDWSWKMLKATFSEKSTVELDNLLKADPLFGEFVDKAGGYVAPIVGDVGKAYLKEESFASAAARKLPFVRRSERSFNTYLNYARFDSYKATRNAMEAMGQMDDKSLKMLGSFVNLASGRGEIPKSLEKYAPALNSILFSPRLQISTIELPRQIGRMLLSDNPYMRKEAAKALVTFVGGGASLIGLLNATGVSKVELDPRSGDFGKIKIGETRLDIWRGYVQYARFAAQILTGERKSAYGNMNKAKRDEIAWNFLQSKSSPAFGLLVDLLKGEDYQGNPLFTGTTGALKTAKNRFMPIAIQDVMDAVEQNGGSGLWVAAPSVLGVGTLTYVNDYVLVKDKIAKAAGYKNWDAIDPTTQKKIQNSNVELQAATIKFDRQVMGTAWGDWRQAGLAVEDTFRTNVDKAVAKYQVTGDGYEFRNKINDAYTARRGGYDARMNNETFSDIVKRLNLKNTTESMVALGPEQMAIKTYNDALYGKDMYDQFGDYRFEEAAVRKEQLHKMLGDKMFNYVEDYQGVKYETYPPEFQDLIKARTILKPYWEIQSQVESVFGTPKTLSQQRRIDSLISRMKKKLRRTNPDMEKYLQMFYTQT